MDDGRQPLDPLQLPGTTGRLVVVVYSMTAAEPAGLWAVGLGFERGHVALRAAGGELLARYERVCGAGLCMDDESCYNATHAVHWKDAIGSPLTAARWLHAAVGQEARLRLEFGSAAVEIRPENGYVWVSGADGDMAWGGPPRAGGGDP